MKKMYIATHSFEHIAEITCNPSFDHIDKGQLAAEVDVMDDACVRCCDVSGVP